MMRCMKVILRDLVTRVGSNKRASFWVVTEAVLRLQGRDPEANEVLPSWMHGQTRK